MMINQKSLRLYRLNKKLVGIGIGIVIVIIILLGTQSYRTMPENITNRSSVQQFPNATLQKPVNAGKHITIELTESMHLASP